MNKNIDIGGRLHSTATGNVVTGANEVFDDDKNKKQSEINTETYSLVNDINERLNGLSPDQQSALSVAAKATSNETKLGYYVCGTEDNVAAKVISDAIGYVLSTGGSIKVKMTNANTANNATLNINSTGAKPLYYDGERASANNTWEAGETVEVYYDGTNFYANNVAGGSGSGDGAFDVSAKYPTSGVEGGNTYTLEGALAVLNASLSADKKQGGMSIKFVESSDNKYVQYMLDAQFWTTEVGYWEKMNIENEVTGIFANTFNFSATTNTYTTTFVDYKFINGHRYLVHIDYPDGVNASTYISVRGNDGTALQNNIGTGTATRDINFTCNVDDGERWCLTVVPAHESALNFNARITDLEILSLRSLKWGIDNVEEELDNLVVSTNQIADNAINTNKIANNAITDTKINTLIRATLDCYLSGDNNYANTESDGTYLYITGFSLYVRGGTNMTVANLAALKSAIGQEDYDIAPSGANSIKLANQKKLVLRNNVIEIINVSDHSVFCVTLLACVDGINVGGLFSTCYLGRNSIITNRIVDGAITLSKLASSAVDNSKIADEAVSLSKISQAAFYDGGLIKTDVFNFASGQSYPWHYILRNVDIKVGDKIEWLVETESTDKYWIASRDAGYNTVQYTNEYRGSNSGIFIATQNAKYFALGIRQMSSYTGDYTLVVRRVLSDTTEIKADLFSMKKYTPYGTDILTLNPEEEVLSVLKNMNQRLRNSSFVEQDKQFVLLQLTDQHADEIRMNRAMLFEDHYHSYINNVIHTGDIIHDNWADGIAWFSNVENYQKILQVIGNHDVSVKAGSDGKVYTDPNDLSQYIETNGYIALNKTNHRTLGYKNSNNEIIWADYNDIYNRYIAPYVSNWGVVQPANAASEGLNYFYKDYSDQGIRLIVLDCMMYDTAQNTWLINILSDAKTNGYGVIIAEHYPIKLNGFDYCAFTSSGNLDVDDFYESEGTASTLSEAQQAVDDFMTAGGEFICWLAGHTHKDFCGVLKDYPKQVMFISSTTGINGTAWSDDVRTIGTRTEDLFTLIAVDRYKKIVRFYRIGNQWDRYARHKVSMAVDYRAAKMVYSS